MIKKYVFGSPFETEAVTARLEAEAFTGKLSRGEISLENGFCYSCQMDDADVIYGLGEANRGINKRGYQYVSNCTDDPNHTEEKTSLYGAHNFIVISGEKHVGLFFDYPASVCFDIGYTRQDMLTVRCERADLYLYVITGEGAYDIVKQFRKIIGKAILRRNMPLAMGRAAGGIKLLRTLRRL